MISENKVKHMLGVARECEKLAKNKGLPEDMQIACFIMGFLHDIGYEHAPDVMAHPTYGFDILCKANQYKHEIAHAVRDHGKKYNQLTIFDEILNTADLTVNFQGESVDIATRLAQIEEKYGVNSEHYQDAVRQAEAITHLHNY